MDQSSQRNQRINMPDMFMNAALWMERSELAENPFFIHPQPVTASEDRQNESKSGNPVRVESKASELQRTELNKCGAVYVLANNRILSADCSKGGVHAAVSALIKFGHERVKGCRVFLSRLPCSSCTKLLVQCEVSKVFFLPIEPELKDHDDIKCVENIFKSSSTGLSIFIPRVGDSIIQDIDHQTSPFNPRSRDHQNITDKTDELVGEYWNHEWVTAAWDFLKWPALSDTMMEQTTKDIKNLLKWLASVTYGDLPDSIKFAEIDPNTRKEKKVNTPTSTDGSSDNSNGAGIASWKKQGIPTTCEESWQKHARHMCRMARMLSQRSDDPTRRVGCVLMFHNEVIATGWNGFPAKALYGEFPRASSPDHFMENKENYVIHAEQNALLTRTKRNLKNKTSIIFVSKIPAPECIPMLVSAGVRHIVVPKEPSDDPENTPFFQALEGYPEGFTGYWPIEQQTHVARALSFQSEQAS